MNKIKFLRSELNITVRDAASLFDLSGAVISQYENEKRDLNTSIIKKLADYFRVTIDYLLCYSELGLYVNYEDSDLKIVITESDYLKYKDDGLIYYVNNKRFINLNKRLGLPSSYNLSKLLDTLTSYDDLESNLSNNQVKVSIPIDKSTVIKKIITLNDEKFKVIEKMLEIM